MPRANRHYIPGYVWHITHRCHKKEFLLKFARDRRRYLQWLFEARKRYGLSVLNYTVTFNHVHLLVRDDGDRDVIPKSIPLMAGRSGQEFNQRKSRKGAYWEDRYHATAVETDKHLMQCLVYIDLNMVRAGVVEHPKEGIHFRDEKWTERVAVGSEAFVTATKEKLGFKAKGREVIGGDGSYELREFPGPYQGILRDENAVLMPQNEYFWEDIGCMSG